MRPSVSRRASARRGLTLVELLVGLSVGLLVSGVAVGSFITQQRALQGFDGARLLSGASRDAVSELENALRRTGWGIDPRYAIDFRSYSCTTPPCRDKSTAPDALVFVSRNPFYSWNDVGTNGCATAGGCFSGNAWPISSASTGSITITAQAGAVFRRGQVVLATCTNGTGATMATVSTLLTVATAGSVSVSLLPAVAGNPYRENNLPGSCIGQTGSALFLVDRSRYLVRTYNGVPWLMFDNGLDNDNNGTTAEFDADVNEYVPIAPGVEDFQVAYGLNTPTWVAPPTLPTAPDTDRDWIVGDATTTEEPNPTLTAPVYATPVTDATRFNLHPANIRSVRVSLSLRTVRPDGSKGSTWIGDAPVATENHRTALPSQTGGYRRLVSSTTVGLRNMQSRSPFIF